MNPPTQPLDTIGPRERMHLLTSLETHPAFHLFCERHAAILAQDLDAKIFDPVTPDDECRLLRLVRKRFVEHYTPDKILKALLLATETEAKRNAAKMP